MTTRVWPFRPQVNVVESYEWYTYINRCREAEYRYCKRPIPRAGFTFQYIMRAAEYGVARELANLIGADTLYVPDWPRYTQVPSVSPSTVTLPVDASMTPSYKVGGKLLLWGSNEDYEVCSIQGIGEGTISISAVQDFHDNPCVVPLREGTITQEFGADRGPTDFSVADIVFQVPVTEDLTPTYGEGLVFSDYLGSPVMTSVVEMNGGARENHPRVVDEVDSIVGLVRKTPVYTTPDRSFLVSWTTADREELWNVLLWLHSRKGRWKNFWLPSWNEDVHITTGPMNNDTTIEVDAVGFASAYSNPTDLLIMTQSGGGWPVRVTGATPGETGKELLQLSEPFQTHVPGLSGIPLQMISRTCRLTLSRLNSDRVEVHHQSGDQATIVVPTVEVPS